MKQDDDKDDICLKDAFSLESSQGWIRMELVSKHPIPDEQLPFVRGSLIRIKKSPRPDKIPDNAIAMLVDYGWSAFRTNKEEIQGLHKHQFEPFTSDVRPQTFAISELQEPKQVQFRMKVLFNECVIELINTKPEELGKNYVKVRKAQNNNVKTEPKSGETEFK